MCFDWHAGDTKLNWVGSDTKLNWVGSDTKLNWVGRCSLAPYLTVGVNGLPARESVALWKVGTYITPLLSTKVDNGGEPASRLLSTMAAKELKSWACFSKKWSNCKSAHWHWHWHWKYVTRSDKNGNTNRVSVWSLWIIDASRKCNQGALFWHKFQHRA